MQGKRLLRSIGCVVVGGVLLIQPGHPFSVRYNLIDDTRQDASEQAMQATRVLGGVFLVLGVLLALGKLD